MSLLPRLVLVVLGLLGVFGGLAMVLSAVSGRPLPLLEHDRGLPPPSREG